MKTKIAAALVAAPMLMANEGGCDVKVQKPTYVTEQRTTEANQARLVGAIPPPVLETSLERKNLVERLSRINKENMTGCIYLISYGNVIAFYPVRGKVTSLNSYLSGETQLIKDPYAPMDGSQSASIEMPDYDGAYGKNADGVFFFTADSNAYVEWNGEYLWSDQCLARPETALVRVLGER